MKTKISKNLVFGIVLFGIVFGIQDISVPEVIVVVLTEKDYPFPKSPISDGLKYEGRDVIIKNVSHIQIEENDTERDVCEKIFESTDRPPTILIDTIRYPRDIDNRKSSITKLVARKMGVPTVSTSYGLKSTITGWENMSTWEKEYLIQVSPPGDVIPQVVKDICSVQSFEMVGIIYDKAMVFDQKYIVLLENLLIRHIIQVVDNSFEDIETKMQDMRPEISNFFVIGSKEIIENALNAANKLNLFGRKFSWFLITKDNVEELSCSCLNMTAILMSPLASRKERLASILRMVGQPQKSEMDTAFYFDLAEMIVQVLKKMKEKEMFPWELIYPSCNNTILITEQKIQRNIKFFTTFKQFPFEGTFGKFRFEDSSKGNFQAIKLKIEKIQFLKSKRIKTDDDNIGTWVYQSGKGTIAFDSGKNLNEFKAVNTYRVTTVVQPPFIYKTNKSGEIVFTGYCVDLLDMLKDLLGFEYTIFEAADGKFGAVDDNNEWNGMIRELQEKKADIALGPISVMAERESVVDFTHPYYFLVGMTILMKKTEIDSSLFKFVTVLESKVWGCIVAAYCFVSFLMFLSDKFSPYSFQNNREKYKYEAESRDFTMKECFWFCMTSVTPQGGGEAPRSISGKLIAATWWLFGYIVITSYTANLAAFLTVSRLDSAIESLDDLAKQHKIKYAPQKDTASMMYFKGMAHIEDTFYNVWRNMILDDSINETERAKLAVWDYPISDKYTKIWLKMKENKMPETFFEGVERVKNSTPDNGFAFVADTLQVEYAVKTNCDLVRVGREFSRKPVALAVQKGSLLKYQITKALLQIWTAGDMGKLSKPWMNNNPYAAKCDDNDQQSGGISIANIGGVFIIVSTGFVLSYAALAIEYWCYKGKRSTAETISRKH